MSTHKNSKMIFIFLAFSVILISIAFGQTEKAAKAPAQPALVAQKEKAVETSAAQPQAAGIPQGVKEMKKEELAKEIVQALDYTKETIKAIPGMEMVKDEKGAVSYVYKSKDGKMVRLENLDRETLEFIFIKVRNEKIKINNEKTMKQMKEIRRIQEMNRQTRALNMMNQQRNLPAYKPAYKSPQLPKLPPAQPGLPRNK